MKVLYGYTPSFNYLKEKSLLSQEQIQDQIKNDIDFEMKTGRKKMLPSFIGELIITDLNDDYQRLLLKYCYDFNKATGCPLLLNVGANLNMLIALNQLF